MSASFPLDEIPVLRRGFQRGKEIQVVRWMSRPTTKGPAYEAYVPLTAPLTVTVSILGRDRSRVSATESL